MVTAPVVQYRTVIDKSEKTNGTADCRRCSRKWLLHFDQALESQREKRLESFGFALIVIPATLFNIFVFILKPVLGLIIQAVIILLGFLLVKRGIEQHEQIQAQKQGQENYLANLHKKREAIAYVVQNQEITGEEKRVTIQQILQRP